MKAAVKIVAPFEINPNQKNTKTTRMIHVKEYMLCAARERRVGSWLMIMRTTATGLLIDRNGFDFPYGVYEEREGIQLIPIFISERSESKTHYQSY
jgi:hypothetical protein